MCLKLSISTWRREKYFASISITTNFIISDGWKEKPPRLNQDCAPLEVCPIINNKINRKENIPNSATRILVLFRNLKSIKDNAKSTAKEIPIHINWCEKKGVSSVKDFIVISPAERTGKIKRISSQSILNKRDFIKS